jgi:protease IV
MSTYNFNPPPNPATPPAAPVAQPPGPPGPPAPPPNGRSRTLLWVVIGGGAFFLFVLAVFTLVYLAVKSDQRSSETSAGLFADKIGVVELHGVIWEAKPYVEQMKRYEDDSSIKAIIIEIDSPGGGSEASQELYEYVKRYRDKKKKPVISAIRTVGASGAYYVAAGTNKIYAGRSSIVGSIGVIAQWVNYGDLMRWAKLKDVTLKAGELKDTGNPTRDLTPEEKAYLQELIDNMHMQFIRDVAQGRNQKEEDLLPLATGRVWTGEQAEPLKLIDKVADFQTVVEETAKSVGISGEPKLVRPTREHRTLADVLFGDISEFLPDKARMMSEHVGFYYLWKH